MRGLCQLKSCFVLLPVLIMLLPATPVRADSKDLVRDMISRFTQIRMGYAAAPTYSPIWEKSEERAAIIQALRSQDAPKVIALSGIWLENNPVDVEIHKIRAMACAMEDDWAGYFRHLQFYSGLLASIASSGNGLDPGEPIKVIAVHEEYYFLNALGAKVTRQSLIDGMIDKMECVIDGKPKTFYFDVSISMNHIRNELEESLKK